MSTRIDAPGRPIPGPVWSRFAERSRQPMSRRDVLVHAPSIAFQAPGGGEVQLLRTASHLERLGVAVRPFNPWLDRIEDARLLHLFGMSREGLELARLARARRVPIALSPICWFEPRALAALASSTAAATLNLAKWATRRLIPSLPSWRRELLDLADAVLPNSRAEADQLARLFGVDRRKVCVVPNGVDPHFASADPVPFRAMVGSEPFVLYVGRIEPRKNVLRLIRAMSEQGRRLVLIGDAVPTHEAYARECRDAGRDFAIWLPRLDPDDPLLASAYASARALALPSWFETPGLVALEAALATCPVVLTPFGSTREYFGDRVTYANPGSIASIAAALDIAWTSTRSTELAQIVKEGYLWSHVARRTAEIYDAIAP
jgi:glycosyltransferase involved in cell wall biosynthesis